MIARLIEKACELAAEYFPFRTFHTNGDPYLTRYDDRFDREKVWRVLEVTEAIRQEGRS